MWTILTRYKKAAMLSQSRFFPFCKNNLLAEKAGNYEEHLVRWEP